MPMFAYKGFDTRGKVVSGMKDADNVRALRMNLKRDGVLVSEVKETSANAKSAAATEVAVSGVIALLNPIGALKLIKERRKANKLQVAVLTRQLGTLLRAGVPLAESLGALVEQIETPSLKRVIADIKTAVNEGIALGDAMSKHPAIFEELYVNMIRAGEASGTLEPVLFRLAEFLDAQNRLRSKVISAMFYPITMVVLGAVILGILMVSVVPKVTTIFDDMGRTLPWNTQLLIAVSRFFAGYWWSLIVIIPAIVVGFRKWQASPNGRKQWDRFVLKAPIFGDLARQIAITRFAKTLSTMLAAGVPLLRALDIVKAILGNTILTKVVEDAKESIKEGESIAAPLRRSGEFPPLVTHMIAVGERSGQLEQMLENVAQAYDLEVDFKIQRMTTLLEPLMIMLMGGSVAFVVFSILMPIMEMNEFVS